MVLVMNLRIKGIDDCGLWVVGCGLSVVGYRLSVVGYRVIGLSGYRVMVLLIIHLTNSPGIPILLTCPKGQG
jgi:hypothetical protein